MCIEYNHKKLLGNNEPQSRNLFDMVPKYHNASNQKVFEKKLN